MSIDLRLGRWEDRYLFRAVRLRMWVRRAIDIGDIDSLRILNRRADEAVARLTQEQFRDYYAWAISS